MTPSETVPIARCRICREPLVLGEMYLCQGCIDEVEVDLARSIDGVPERVRRQYRDEAA